MKATVWGCRGSLAAPGAETVRYGGNTSCVHVQLDDGTPVVLDAGTGIRLLGLELARLPRRPIHLCLTHLHLDHLSPRLPRSSAWFHHDPLHTDDQLRLLEARARALWRADGRPPELAYEGMELACGDDVEAQTSLRAG
jgi:glyoxylase-like metal-dependent hydrolase (beta-lactamase superfamily II)